jgi:hypothetical protein
MTQDHAPVAREHLSAEQEKEPSVPEGKPEDPKDFEFPKDWGWTD